MAPVAEGLREGEHRGGRAAGVVARQQKIASP